MGQCAHVDTSIAPATTQSTVMWWWRQGWLLWAIAAIVRPFAFNYGVAVALDALLVTASAGLAMVSLVIVKEKFNKSSNIWPTIAALTILIAVPFRMLSWFLLYTPAGVPKIVLWIGAGIGLVWLLPILLGARFRGVSEIWWWCVGGGLWLLGWIVQMPNVTTIGFWTIAGISLYMLYKARTYTEPVIKETEEKIS